METKNDLNIFWMLPAGAFLFHVLLAFLIAHGPRPVRMWAGGLYEPMFFVTPVIGIIVLLSLLVILIVHRPLFRRIKSIRTIILALLDVISPPIVLVLGIVLSGFSR